MPTENQPHPIGKLFQEKREERNLSLREVENATSIRINFLEAIENGTITTRLSSVYAQGFIKQYATYLGLDGDTLLKEHPELLLGNKQRGQHFAYGIGTLEMRNSHTRGARGNSNAIWIAAFFGVLLLAWIAARYLEVI